MESVNDEQAEDVWLSAFGSWPTQDWPGPWPDEDLVGTEVLTIWGLPKLQVPNSPMQDCGPDIDEFMFEESMNEDGVSDGGQAKKRKLETFSDPSEHCSSHGSSGDVIESEEDENEDREMLEHHKILNFSIELAKCNFFKLKRDYKDSPSDFHSLYPSTEEIVNLMKDKVEYLCDDPSRWIRRKIDFKSYIFHVHSLYEAVKCLFENVPYIMGDETVEEVEKMVDMESPPFNILDDYHLKCAVKIHMELLQRTQAFFHPLLRKSYKNEFFAIVDAAAEIEERKFVMGFWRNACFAENEVLFLQLSRAKGLRDEKYMYCCNQIKLQECLDFGLYYSKQFMKIDDLLRWELIRLPSKHDSVIRNLMDTESIVPKKFKDALHPDLIRLSVEAFVKSYSKEKQQEQAYMQLQLLEDARCRRTSDVDNMLNDLLSEFPCISNFPKEGFPVTPPLEERFRDVVQKIKKMWFPHIADHYVTEVILLYIKHSQIKPAASWPTDYLRRRTIYKTEPDDICHKHWMYQHVMDVEFSLKIVVVALLWYFSVCSLNRWTDGQQQSENGRYISQHVALSF